MGISFSDLLFKWKCALIHTCISCHHSWRNYDVARALQSTVHIISGFDGPRKKLIWGSFRTSDGCRFKRIFENIRKGKAAGRRLSGVGNAFTKSGIREVVLLGERSQEINISGFCLLQ